MGPHIGQKVISRITRFNTGIGFFAGLLCFAIVCTVVADVMGRAFFSHPLAGASEYSTALLVALIYLGLPSTQAKGSNFRMEIVTEKLPKSVRRVLELFYLLIFIIFLIIISYFTITYAAQMTEAREVTWGVYELPVWPQRIIIAISMVLLTIQSIADFVRVAWNKERSHSDNDENNTERKEA